MFYNHFGDKKKSIDSPDTGPVENFDITHLNLTLWSEHCLECSAPLCYKTCPKFRRRIDNRCQLFENGIVSVKNPYASKIGFQVIFHGWSRLQTRLSTTMRSVKSFKLRNSLTHAFTSVFLFFSKVFSFLKIKRPWFFSRLGYKFASGSLRIPRISTKKASHIIIRADYLGKQPCVLFFEIHTREQVFYRRRCFFTPGKNVFLIPIEDYSVLTHPHSFISIYPETEGAHPFNFYELGLCCLKPKVENRKEKKAKCVVWDLDNTLWNGILSENDQLVLNERVMELIKKLDSKGIVNSIISKNDFEDAKKKLVSLGVFDYFVMPQINWKPKSANMKTLLSRMNINQDTVIYVDDNPVELAEIHGAFSSIECLNVADIYSLENSPRIDVPITKDGQRRKDTYKMMDRMIDDENSYSGSNDDFLVSCGMSILVKKPETEDEISRCAEIAARTNQLNSSGEKLDEISLRSALDDKGALCLQLACKDRYGEYGIVGFARLLIAEKEVLIRDFMISCRVANRKVEHRFIEFLSCELFKEKDVYFAYKKTSRNEPISHVIDDFKMLKGHSSLMGDYEGECYKILERKPSFDKFAALSYKDDSGSSEETKADLQ